MTLIYFDRRHLFDACRVGFMAQSIDVLWCQGWVYTDRLGSLPFPYTVVSKNED